MDEETLRYYEAFAEELAHRYDNASGGIERLLPRPSAVGCGYSMSVRALAVTCALFSKWALTSMALNHPTSSERAPSNAILLSWVGWRRDAFPT
jgi:hypothetical protein